MIDAETRATIRRLHFNRHMTINAVAEALGVHHDTVRRVIATSRVESMRMSVSELESYEAKVLETLEIYPKLPASRILLMLKEHGYHGRLRTVQRWVKTLRPRVSARIYKEVHVLPGEQAQVDWGSFGSLSVGNAKRRLNAFVMVLSYSRSIFVRFIFDQTLESLLDCHRHAFQFFTGIPRNIFYDNMKTVVSDRIGSKVRFHKDFLNFSWFRAGANTRYHRGQRALNNQEKAKSSLAAGRVFANGSSPSMFHDVPVAVVNWKSLRRY